MSEHIKLLERELQVLKSANRDLSKELLTEKIRNNQLSESIAKLFAERTDFKHRGREFVCITYFPIGKVLSPHETSLMIAKMLTDKIMMEMRNWQMLETKNND